MLTQTLTFPAIATGFLLCGEMPLYNGCKASGASCRTNGKQNEARPEGSAPLSVFRPMVCLPAMQSVQSR